MTIILGILKVIGVLLLIVLIVTIVLLLLVLFVPIRYKAAAEVDDPEGHDEFPIEVLKGRSDVKAEVSWLFGAFKVLLQYPGEKLLVIKLFGRAFSPGKKEKEPEKPAKEEEKKEEPEESGEGIFDRIERILDMIDSYWRVLTGTCGRRLVRKLSGKLVTIGVSMMPTMWKLKGTLGLNDPCLNGRVALTGAMLMPYLEDHVQMNPQWEKYRFDLDAELSGKLVMIIPVKEVLPLFFDKDVKKIIKKLKRVRAKFS
ncbi:MAG TPA: hypothetical protein DCF49_08085 [Lachnospiraceae bacterium]|nr:hypothetical protein [Lachnospiraceae bacterium]